jgi:hypothetical protein
MAWTSRDDLRLTIRMGLTRGLTRVHGMRRQLSEEERDRIADAIIDQLNLSNYRIELGPPVAGHGGGRPA